VKRRLAPADRKAQIRRRRRSLSWDPTARWAGPGELMQRIKSRISVSVLGRPGRHAPRYRWGVRTNSLSDARNIPAPDQGETGYAESRGVFLVSGRDRTPRIDRGGDDPRDRRTLRTLSKLLARSSTRATRRSPGRPWGSDSAARGRVTTARQLDLIGRSVFFLVVATDAEWSKLCAYLEPY
jgi:hypothetical protein